MAIGAIRAIRESLSSSTDPPLTTIRQPNL
jgi:hypothetical protein